MTVAQKSISHRRWQQKYTSGTTPHLPPGLLETDDLYEIDDTEVAALNAFPSQEEVSRAAVVAISRMTVPHEPRPLTNYTFLPNYPASSWYIGGSFAVGGIIQVKHLAGFPAPELALFQIEAAPQQPWWIKAIADLQSMTIETDEAVPVAQAIVDFQTLAPQLPADARVPVIEVDEGDGQIRLQWEKEGAGITTIALSGRSRATIAVAGVPDRPPPKQLAVTDFIGWLKALQHGAVIRTMMA